MISYRDINRAIRGLELDRSCPVMVHASLSAFNQVRGGADTIVGVLLENFETIVAPAFTYKTMISPDTGPLNNGMVYGRTPDANKMAEFFYPHLPVDKLIGIVPETIRRLPEAKRTRHPILSFVGINAEKYLKTQNLEEPLAPIAAMADDDAWVLMLGVDHNNNTSIHLGERLAGRKTFIRWAMVPNMIVECKGFPSCSDGFPAIEPLMTPFTRKVMLGETLIKAVPMPEMVETARQLVRADPLALLCERPDCARCNAVRDEVENAKGSEPFG